MIIDFTGAHEKPRFGMTPEQSEAATLFMLAGRTREAASDRRRFDDPSARNEMARRVADDLAEAMVQADYPELARAAARRQARVPGEHSDALLTATPRSLTDEQHEAFMKRLNGEAEKIVAAAARGDERARAFLGLQPTEDDVAAISRLLQK